jgi:hypothetical protein
MTQSQATGSLVTRGVTCKECESHSRQFLYQTFTVVGLWCHEAVRDSSYRYEEQQREKRSVADPGKKNCILLQAQEHYMHVQNAA